MEPSVLTARQVADRLQVSEVLVLDWLRRGLLKGEHHDGEWRVRLSDLEEFVDAGQPGGAPSVRAEQGTVERVRDEASGEHELPA